jgi:hypothetical protein
MIAKYFKPIIPRARRCAAPKPTSFIDFLTVLKTKSEYLQTEIFVDVEEFLGNLQYYGLNHSLI